MKRKIIKQGHNTFTITLPSAWTRKLNLNPGDEIDLIENGSGLLISANGHSEKKSIEFDISNMDIPTIWKHFMGVYRAGYDEIRVMFEPRADFEHPYKYSTHHAFDTRFGRDKAKETVLEALHSIVNRFIGMEIVEYGQNYVLVKDMGETSPKEFDNSMRRIFLLILQMANETSEAIKLNKPEMLQHIHDVDISLDKFHDYCIRVMNKTICKGDKKSRLICSILYILEMMGDEFKNIANHLNTDFKGAKLSNILSFAENVKKQVDLFYEVFYKYDQTKAGELSELDKKSYLLYPDIYKKATEAEKEVFHHLRMITRYVNALLERIIEVQYSGE